MSNLVARIPIKPTSLCLMLMTILWLVIPTPANAQAFTASTLGDYGNVTVMEATGSYDARNADGSENLAARQAVAKEFFRIHKDEYDFLVIFSNFDYQMIEGEADAFYHAVRNDIKGIGIPVFKDLNQDYGSNEKLQGTIDMGNIAKHATDPLDLKFNETLSTLSHEMLHRWGAYAKFKDASNADSSALLGRNGGHWSFLLDSGGSLMYGNKWQANGNNTFTSLAPQSEQKFYSPLDLYLMGMLDKSQVPPMLLIENAAIDPTRLPEANVTISGQAKTVTIDDIIAAMGERDPSASTSQKSFKTAFIFLTQPGTFTGQEIYGIENIRNGAVTRFSVLTDGKSIMEVASTPKADVPVNPGVLPPSTTLRPMANIDEGVAWIISNQRTDGSWMDLAQTIERDTAEAVLTLKPFLAGQTNVQAGLLWLGSTQALNVDYLCRKIEAMAASGADTTELVWDLLERRNSDGGWGSERTYASNAADTALALKALSIAGAGDQQAISKAIQYLRSSQKSMGGWTGNGESTIQATAAALSSLNRYRGQYPLDADIAKGAEWLLSKKIGDAFGQGSEATIYDTALAVLVLRELDVVTSITNPAVDFLRTRQDVNGSWNSSVFETALAVKAILKGNVDPDLVVRPSDITFTPVKISALPSSVVINVAVSNTGMTTVPQAKVTLYDGAVNDTNKIGETIVAVSSQATGTQSAKVTFSTTISDGNEHTFIAVVDPVANESNKSNNQAGRTLQVQETHDFEVLSGDVKVSPATAMLLQDVAISAKISNKGTKTAYSVPVKYSVTASGVEITIAEVPVDIPANGSVTKIVNWRASRAGTDMPVTVQVVPSEAFPELSVTNNSASTLVTINSLTEPNVSVSYKDLVVTPDTLLEGKSATISAIVRNDGGSAVSDVAVKFYSTASGTTRQLPQDAPATMNIPLLEPGQSAAVSLTWNNIPDPGSTIVTVKAYPQSGTSEIRMDDNEAFTTVMVKSLPELAISTNAITIQPAFPNEKDLITITVTVQNSGDQEATDVKVRALEGATPIGLDQTITLLAGHATATVGFSYGTTVSKGAHEIMVEVDPQNRITERNKENNRATRSFGVQDADLWGTERYFSPNGDGIKDATELFFRLPSPQTVTVEVVNKKGETVRNFSGTGLQNISAGSVLWDGLNNNEKIADDGVYRFKVLNGDKAELGSATVVLDNNRSSINDAIGTPYLLNNMLTCPLPEVSNWKWYSDESGIVFQLTDNVKNTTGYTQGLYTMSPDGDSVIRLIPGGWTSGKVNGTDFDYNIWYDISPNNEKIAFIVTKYNWRKGINEGSQLWVVDRDGSNLNMLVNRDLTKEYAPLNSLKWSSRGDELLVDMTGLNRYSSDVWIVKLDGTPPYKIDSDSGFNLNDVQWSPDGSQFVYPVTRYDDAGNSSLIIRLYATGSGARDLASVASGDAARLAWLNGAKVLLYNQNSISILDADDSSRNATIATGITSFPVVAPNGSGFAFKVQDNGNAVLNISDPSGAVRVVESITPVNPLCQADLSSIVWSPDGGAIAYKKSITRNIVESTIQCVAPEFSVWDKTSGEKRLLPDLSPEMGLTGWMSDGRTIVATREAWPVSDLVFVNSSTGEISTTLTEGMSYGLSPREHYLTYVRKADDTTPCSGTSWTDIGAISSLLNLTADLRIARDKSFIALKGIAADLNFEGYRLDYADSKDPMVWNQVAPPSDSPVMNGTFITWVPPYKGTFLVRLTVWDKAGNTAIDRKRVSWGQASSLSNLAASPRMISPANQDNILDFVELRYHANEPVHLEFAVLDKEGVVVKTFYKDHTGPADDLITWNGQNEQGSFVHDGEYTIKVFDLLFPVTVDNTIPGANVRFGSIVLDSNSSAALTILHGRATDDHIKNWVLEYSSDTDPISWVEYMRGEKPLGKADGTDEAIVSLNVFGAIPLPGRQFKLTVEDLAGNRNSAVSDRIAEQVLLNKYDGVQLKVVNGELGLTTPDQPELKPGTHTFDVYSTLRQAVKSWTVQYSQDYSETTNAQNLRIRTWNNWKDIAVDTVPATGVVNLQWQAPILDASKPAAVKVKAIDILDRELSSGILIVKNAFEIGPVCSSDPSAVAFSVQNYVFTTDIKKLRFEIAPEPTLSAGTAQMSVLKWQPVRFSLEPNGALIDSLPTSGAALPSMSFAIYVPADRFASGIQYYIRMIGVTDQGEQRTAPAGVQREDDPFASKYRLELAVVPEEASCGQISTGKTELKLQVIGPNNPGSLPPAGSTFLTTSYVMKEPSGTKPLGQFEFVPQGLGILTVDTTLLSEGPHEVEAVLNYRTNCGVSHTRFAYNMVYSDRALPMATIHTPVQSSTVCAIQYPGEKGGTWYGIPVDATVADNNGVLQYRLFYAAGADPAESSWLKAETYYNKNENVPIEGPKIPSSTVGLTTPWLISGITGTNFSLRLEAVDVAGNKACTTTNFIVSERVTISGPTVDKYLFSPIVGEGKVKINFSVDEYATAAVTIHKLSGDSYDTVPVRTLTTPKKYPAGQGMEFWDGKLDNNDFGDGKYAVVVTASDPCGHTAVNSIPVEVDAISPLASIIYPRPGDSFGTIIEVTGTASDLNLQSYTLEAGQGPAPAPNKWTLVKTGQSPVSSNVLGTWNNFGIEGEWTLRLTVLDMAGNTSVTSVLLNIGQRTSLISDLSVKPGLISPNNDGKVDGTIIGYGLTDACAVSIEISHGGAIVHSYTTNALSAGAYSHDWKDLNIAGITVPDDTYTVRLTATKTPIIEAETVTILVDTTKPVVEIAQPPDNAYLSKRDVSVMGKITDQNIAEYTVSYTGLSGSTLIDKGSQSRTDYLFGTLNDLAEGAYTLLVKAKDLGENETIKSIPFTIDRTPPVVKMDAPKDGAYHGTVVSAASGTTVSNQTSAAVSVTGSIVEQNLATFSLRYGSGDNPALWTDIVTGTTVTALPSPYTWNVGGIQDGLYTLSLLATDKAGLKSETKVKITVDNTPPAAVITAPLEGGYVKGAIEVTGTAADQNLDKYAVEVSEGLCATAFKWAPIKKGSTPVTGGSLASWLALPADGEYCLRLTATDKIGSTAEAKVNVKVDTKPPAAPVIAGVMENKTNASLTWQSVSDSDLAGYNVYRGGQKMNNALITELLYLDQNLTEGLFTFTVKAVDKAGWESPASNEVKLRVDITGPDAKILSPAAGAVVGDLVDIKGRAFSSEDFKHYRVSIGKGADPTAWSVIRTSSLPTSYGVLAQWDTLGLVEKQIYTIKLEAEDLAGNITTDRISITIDNTPPDTPVLAPPVVDGSSVTLQWSDSLDNDLAGYLLFVNDRLVNASSNMIQADMKPYVIPCPSYYHYDLPDGTFTYAVAAMDRAGLMSALSPTVSVTIDTRAPQIAIVEPATVLVNGQRKADIGGKTVIGAESPDLDIDTVTFYYSESGSNNWVSIGESRQAPYAVAFTPAVLGMSYDLKAEAVDKHVPLANRGISPLITLTYKDLTPPPVPTGLSATVNRNTVSILWTAATDTDTVQYKLYRTVENERGLATSALLLKQTSAYQDVLQADGAYSYDITAVDAAGNASKPSLPISARIYAPVIDQLATQTTLSTVHIIGSNAASQASVRIEIASQAGVSTVVATADQTGRFSADTTLGSGVNTITATATDSAGNTSNVSNMVSIEFDALPAAPTGLVASVQGATITLSWNQNPEPDIAGYLVYRKKGAEWSKITSSPISGITWTDAGLQNGSYQYKVTAVDALSEGPPAIVDMVTIAQALLEPPVNLVATAQPNGEADITWQYPDGTAKGYYVYRSTVENGPYTRITSNLIVATAYHDRGLVHGTTYYYVSTAVDTFGNESGYSVPGSVMALDLTAPEKPVITAPTTSLSPIIITTPTATVAGKTESGAMVELLRNGVPAGTVRSTEGSLGGTYSLGQIVEYAALSPDGTQLAYAVNGSLWMMDLATASSSEILPGGSEPVWSPDGKRIAYTYQDPLTWGNRIGVADIVNGRAENAAPLTTDDPTAEERAPSWSLDGSKIIFTSIRNYIYGVWIKDLASGTLTHEVYEGNVENPRLSPDGSRIAYGRSQYLFVFDRTTGNTSVIVNSVDAWSVAWSPDSRRIAFLSRTSGVDEIYVQTLETGVRTRISNTADHPGWSPYWPSWLPDGRTVVYVNWDDTLGADSILLADAGGQETAYPVVQSLLELSYLAVMSSGDISYIDGVTLSVPGIGGKFAFGAVQLDPGENLFNVTATDGSGNVSVPSDAISVTRDLTQLPDLVVLTDDMAFYPAAPLAGEHAVMSIAVWNRGQTVSRDADVSVYVWNESGDLDLLVQGRVPALEPGAAHLVSAEWDSTGRSGGNRLVAAVDTEQLVSESNETNNMAMLDFFVSAQEGISLTTSLDASQYAGDSAVKARVMLRNSGIAKEGVLSVRIEDENGLLVALLGEKTIIMTYASQQEYAFTWNTGATYAGSYRIHAVLNSPTGSLAEHATVFSIVPETKVSVTVTTDKASYGASEPVGIAVTLNNLGRNRIIPLITTRLTITNEAGTVLFSDEKTTTDMLPGASISLPSVWNTGLSPAGSYTATLETIIDGNPLPVKNALFAVRGSAVVTGTLSLSPDPVPFGAAFRAKYMIENSGNGNTGPVTARIMVIDQESQTVLSTFENQTALVSGSSITGQADFSGLSNGLKTYTVVLQYVNSGMTSVLASTAVTIKDMTAPTMNVLSPVAGTPYTSTVSFLVAASDDASGVDRIEYRRDGGSWSLLPVADPSRGRFGTTWDPTMADNGMHTVSFRVVDRAGNQSEDTVIAYEVQINRAPTAPSPAWPAAGQDVGTVRPEIAVNNASDPNGDSLSYVFELYGDSDLTIKIVPPGVIPEGTGTSAWTVPVDLTENAVYYWRVQAFDGKLYGPWTDTLSFRVNAVEDPPSVPTPTSPADRTEVATLIPVLTVINAVDPDSTSLTYNFQVALDPAFVTVVTSTEGVIGGEGNTSWQVPVPLVEDVRYYWRAQADDWHITGSWSNPVEFTVNTFNIRPTDPSVIAPVDKSEVTTTSLDIRLQNSFDPDSQAITYSIELDTVRTFNSPNLLPVSGLPQGQGTTVWHVDGLLDNTGYFVRTKASDGVAESDWSGVTEFFVNTLNDAPSIPIPANPSNGAGVNVVTPTLSVQNATDIDRDTLTYDFEVYEDPGLIQPAVATAAGVVETPGLTSWTVSATLQENRTYYWRAQAFDGGLASGWTTTLSFTVNTGDVAPDAPMVVAPAEGGSVDSAMPTLTVLNATDPDSTRLTYEFQVFYGAALIWSAPGIAEGTAGSTSATLNIALTDNTAYSWRCRANDGQRDGPWTAMTSFTVHLPQTGIKVDIEVEPETLNQKSKGDWVMVEIELPHGYHASDVDLSSIRLEGTVPAVLWPHERSKHHHKHGCEDDHREHEHGEIKVKFRRSDVIAVLPAGEHVPVHITGTVAGTPFEGVDIIKVIH